MASTKGPYRVIVYIIMAGLSVGVVYFMRVFTELSLKDEIG